MSLYIGTNYHPHDWDLDQWIKDIQLFKKAGFTTVRLGHLCWDSYEPEEGVYTFEWFDEVMDLFAEAEIGVLLDVSTRPAPTWVHKLCPGCDVVGLSGNVNASVRRYMEDIADPSYQMYALRFAEKISSRYKDHPALFAFGLCNELGMGYISHSEYARRRFANWLKKKYTNIESLNVAWTTQRWSRKLNSFDDVYLPETEISIGSPEAWLDMRRFFGEDIANFSIELNNIIKDAGGNKPISSNHYAEKNSFGFDYLESCDELDGMPGMGYYPSFTTGAHFDHINAIYQQRLAESNKPMWCLEFQVGGAGMQCGPKGMLRMYILLCILNRSEMILGWTWRTMLGGEEQFLSGMLDHDGIPNQNYYDYQAAASDIKKLQEYHLPYLPQPEIAMAYSYDSDRVYNYSDRHFKQKYTYNTQEVHRVFYDMNIDYNVVDLRNLKNNYKLLIVPGHYCMEPKMAQTIRDYVNNGGTVIMNGYSATVDETGKGFSTPRPGYLDDVFGLRIGGYQRTSATWTHSEDSTLVNGNNGEHELLTISSENSSVVIDIDYYEKLELNTAQSIASFDTKNLCAISKNSYGKGTAYYMAAETNRELLSWFVDSLLEELQIQRPLKVPEGIQVRKLAEDEYFFVNTTNKEQIISLTVNGYGVLSEANYTDSITLKGYDVELIKSL